MGRVIVALLAAWLSATAPQAASDDAAAQEPLFATRVVDVRIDGVSLERVDLSLQMAVRASRNVTIRTLRFSDGFIETIPVWVTPLEGRWPLRRGQEFVIPTRVAVTAFARDALGAGSLADLLGRTEVNARAMVEMSFDTPWLARMLRTATDVAVTEVAFKAPVPPTSLPQPLARLGAGILEFLQRQAAPGLAAGPDGPAASRDLLERFGRSTATVETEYEIEGGPSPGRRTATTLGLWWTPSTVCTTREALEPWRYDAADASQLQVEGARLRDSAATVRIRSASGQSVAIDVRELRRQLPKPPDRRVYSLATGEPRRMRLALRTAPSALLCLRVGDDAGPAVQTASTPAPAAAFTGDLSRGLVWTETVAAAGSLLTLRTPVHRRSFGSPLVTGDGVVGLVASPDTAWDARAIAAAAARALHVAPRAAFGPEVESGSPGDGGPDNAKDLDAGRGGGADAGRGARAGARARPIHEFLREQHRNGERR
jgi:hypothetical protein